MVVIFCPLEEKKISYKNYYKKVIDPDGRIRILKNEKKRK